MERVANALSDVAVAGAEKWGFRGLQTAGRNLGKVGMTIAREGLVNRWRVVIVARALHEVAAIALNLEPKPTPVKDIVVSYRVVKPLRAIGRIAHEKGLISRKKGVMSGFSRVASALWYLGTRAAVGGLRETASESAKALAELATLDKESVEEALDSFKRREEIVEGLPEFRGLMEAYERELKELGGPNSASQDKERPQ